VRCTVVPSVILLPHAPFQHPISPCEIFPSPSSLGALRACYLSSILPSVFFSLSFSISSRGLRHSPSSAFTEKRFLLGLTLVFATVKLCKGRRRWLSRRTSDAFLRRCCGALYSLRDASFVLHREVCLAWIRLLSVVRGLYTFWAIAQGNALVP